MKRKVWIFLIIYLAFIANVRSQDSVIQYVVNNKTAGLICYLEIFPIDVNDSGVFTVKLISNRMPDHLSATLLINESVINSRSQEVTKKREDVRYISVFRVPAEHKDSTISVDNLSFGGVQCSMLQHEIEESLPEQEPKDSGGCLMLLFVVIVICITSIVGVLVFKHFKREGKEDLATFVRIHHRLNLTTDWANMHYGFPLGILLGVVIITTVGISTHKFDTSDVLYGSWFVATALVLTILCYINQRSKLNFESVRTYKSVEQMQAAIQRIAQQNNWTIDLIDENSIVAHTNRSFPSLTYGEQIFVVFDGRQVWINSINDLNTRATIFSFGYTKRNIKLLKDAIL